MSIIKPITATRHQAELRRKGWSLRAAGAALGVDFSHLHRVVTGQRHSASLLRRVSALPSKSKQP